MSERATSNLDAYRAMEEELARLRALMDFPGATRVALKQLEDAEAALLAEMDDVWWKMARSEQELLDREGACQASGRPA